MRKCSLCDRPTISIVAVRIYGALTGVPVCDECVSAIQSQRIAICLRCGQPRNCEWCGQCAQELVPILLEACRAVASQDDNSDEMSVADELVMDAIADAEGSSP